jgi:enoyl-CoA hydratase/carnithine racemase
MSRATVSLEIERRVGTLTLNRPERANYITADMMAALRDHLRDATGNVDVLIVEAVGADFTRGRDRDDHGSGLSRDDSLALAVDVNRALNGLDAIVVAAVRGRAIGFGCGLAVQCDLVVAAEDAVFGFDEMAHGFPPMIVMSYLGQYVPPKHALELVITHRELNAEEAKALGIVTHVVPGHELEERARAVAAELTQLNIAAVKRAKQYLREVGQIEPERRSAYALQSQIAWFNDSAASSAGQGRA